MSGTQTTYNDKVVRQFAVMTVIWGIVGMLVGVIIAAQLVWRWVSGDARALGDFQRGAADSAGQSHESYTRPRS